MVEVPPNKTDDLIGGTSEELKIEQLITSPLPDNKRRLFAAPYFTKSYLVVSCIY
jgi:hypothetical protein